MRLSDFDYLLPKELIAQHPVEPRDSSRLMVLEGSDIKHRYFYDIIEYFNCDDTIVLNDTRVIPAKLKGKKATGGKVEVLLLSKKDCGYECLIKGKKIQESTQIEFDGMLKGIVREKTHIHGGNRYFIEFSKSDCEHIIETIGTAPLPPYIKEELDNPERYQTIFAKNKGSIAAPTAGLHFTNSLLDSIKRKGVKIAYITLHVGAGTFMPVRTENVNEHLMEPEYYRIDEVNASMINDTQGRLIAAGTTTVKTIESACKACCNGKIHACEGWSNLFIHPPYEFRSGIDALITNFHLPKSTLIMLASAYAGRERLLKAYSEAVNRGYRFYSFGDAMLIFR